MRARMMGDTDSIRISCIMPAGVFRTFLAMLAVVCFHLFLPAEASARTVVSEVRLGGEKNSTRFVLEMNSSVKYRLFTLSKPDRVVLEMPVVDWNASIKGGRGHVKTVRYAPYQKGLGRVVLDLAAPAVVDRHFLLPPGDGRKWRLVVDLKDSEATTTAAVPATKTPVAKPSTATGKAPTAQPARKPVIVLDPGHGGADPGAIGAAGTYEKNITLAFAREAQAAFRKQGKYTVHLTRSRDVFIPLRERIAIARKYKADLFISLHADSTQNASTRGLSVYTLSKTASDAEAAALAEKENKADLIAGMDLSHESPEVTNILIDLAQRETMNLSAMYASSLIDEFGRVVSLLNNTHRFAGFAVLKAPDVPSVLVELGYLSNKQEERLLRQTNYRAKLAKALVRSVDRYFAQTQKAGRP